MIRASDALLAAIYIGVSVAVGVVAVYVGLQIAK